MTPTPVSVAPTTMPPIATVDERYQSYNVEMAEVIGGNFWKPYGGQQAASQAAPIASANPTSARDATFTIGGQDPSLFQERPPIDLANERLRALAQALGPAYVRVSGTWANSAYFHNADDAPPATPPPGFAGILTRAAWQGVIEFARAVNAELVTSFAISAGVRDHAGVWTADQARRVLAATSASGGNIAAAELFNEPTIAAAGGAPPGYDAAMFARDQAVFRAFAEEAAPPMRIVGPGSAGEGIALIPASFPMIPSNDLLSTPPRPNFDIFSYHFYGAVSERCASIGAEFTTTAGEALSEEWLARTDQVVQFYQGLRDRFAPGRPIWLTETADAACGGNPWATTFLDSFRYLDQLGRLAKQGVQAVFHNTLAASEYGLIDQATLAPRPNFWAALLWRRLMGSTVLDAGPIRPGLHLFAHGLRDHPDGFALLALNTSRDQPAVLDLPLPSEHYTLTAPHLQAPDVLLNGQPLQIGPDNRLPSLQGEHIPPGQVHLAPATITFLAITGAVRSAYHMAS